MKKILVSVLILLLLTSAPLYASAKTVARYATQTIALRGKPSGKILRTVKSNAKVKLIKSGKKWATVEYNGETYSTPKKFINKSRSPMKYRGRTLRRSGVIRWGGCRWTWYSQRRLPGRGLKIPGRHVDKQGFVCDRDGYIVVASTRAMRKKRTVVPTPFGKFGKVYDCGAGNSRWRDVYTNW